MEIPKIGGVSEHPPVEHQRRKKAVEEIRKEKKKVSEIEQAGDREGGERKKGGRYA